MIRKLSSTIYFKKSSSTRVPPPLEVLEVNRTFTLIWLWLLEKTEEQITSVLWTKGQMQIQVWAALALRILPWPILICKMDRVFKILTIPTLSSKNCIDKKYICYKSYKSRYKLNRRLYYMCFKYASYILHLT